jgi:glycerophosphoryl diester phosphodiesterase
MSLRTLARRKVGRIFHVQWPVFKHVENSLRGIRRAARRGYDAIDIDMQITKDGVVVGTHWARPLRRDGFRDPRRLIRPGTPISELTWTQVSRLRAGRWPRRYRINRIERLLVACERRRVVAVLEPKGDPRFAEPWVWQHIATVAEDIGATVSVRALHENSAALAPARNVGFEAWEI